MLAAHIAGSSTVYPSIQAAVNAASPGATINVDAGIYPELVAINKPLTIRGAEAGIDARSNVRQSAANESIVTGMSVGSATSSAFYITANDVTIDGFTVQGNTSAGMYGAGIVIGPNQSGTHILNNIIQDNIAGLYLSNNSPTDAAVIQYNVFQNNNNDGANGGRGIYTDQTVSGGDLTNVTIDSNFFYNNFGGLGTTGLEAAIALEAQTQNAQSNIRITNNVMEGNGKGLLAFNVANLTVTSNTITTSQDQYSAALRFEGNANNVTIESNNVYNNPGPAVRIDEKDAPYLSSQFVITGNDFYGNSYAYATPGDSLIVNTGAYSGTLNATNNWWGGASGPSHDGPGTGDGVYLNGNQVAYFPWATTAPVPRDTPFEGLPNAITAPIQAENFNQGGQTFAWYANGRTTNPAGLWTYRNSGVGVQSCSDTGGGYAVGYTAAGQWLDYTVDVAQAGNYLIDFRLASNQTTGGTFHVEIDGVNVTNTLTAANTGDWQTYQTMSSGAVHLTAGQHLVRLVLDGIGSNGAVANFNWFQFVPTTLPAMPTNLQVAAASGTELDLTWTDTDSSITGFSILRQTGASGAFTPLAQISGNSLAYHDTGLIAGTTYSYELVAINSFGNSVFAGPVTAVAPTPPAAPTKLSATGVTATGLTLTWTAPANATGYQIIRQSGSDSGEIIATLPTGSTSFTDSGLSPATQYQYVVSGFNPGGLGAGATLNVQTLAAPPTGLSAVSSQNQVTLSWTPEAGATGYNVYRGTASGAEATTPIATGIVGPGFVDPGLVPGTTYYYVVTAIAPTGESARSSEASAAIAQVAPPAPSGLTTSVTGQQITLNWTASPRTSTYVIYRGTSSGAESKTPIASGLITTSFIDSGAVAGTAYFYLVTALNIAGESGASSEVSAAVPQLSAIVPTVDPKLPASVLAGQKLAANLVITLANSALSNFTGSVKGVFYLSIDGTVDAGSIALPLSLTKSLNLKPHQKLALHLKLAAIPASVPAGTYHLLFQITDPTGAKNTVDVATITVAPPQIDLTGVFSKVPLTETIGKKQTLTISVTNQGTTTATGMLPIVIDASPDGALVSGAVQLLTTSKPINLRPGKSTKITLSFVASSAIPTNSYLIAQLDPVNTFGDVDTANNTFTSSQRIIVK
ncbi:MAG TPA: fibronectin type III domain-containing protein [Tepidisphaeraceae bacterium]|nr:fibronectin type III domain-containing protein [Tepidisphaeraceae bacterium]